MGNCFSTGEVVQRYPGGSAPRRKDVQTAEQRIGAAPAVMGKTVLMHATKGTYPRCCRAQDGTLLGAHTAFENGMSILTITRSTNEGDSWQRIGEVFRAPTSDHDLDNPFLLQLPDGRVLCAFRDHDRHNFGPITLFRIQVCQSVNGGQDWTFLSTATQQGAGPEGVWEPFLRLAADQRTIQIYYAKELPNHKQNCLMQSSNDGGKTWGPPAMVADGGKQGFRHGMIGVCENTGPQDLFAVMESGGPDGFFLSCVQSPDDGRTWTPPRRMKSPKKRGCSCNAPQVINLNGILVCSFHTQEDGGGEKGRRTKLITSHDHGQTWANNTTISNSESAWPGLTALGPDSALVMWEIVGKEGPAVQKFTLR